MFASDFSEELLKIRAERSDGLQVAAQVRKCVLHYWEVPKHCTLCAWLWLCCLAARMCPGHKISAHLTLKGSLSSTWKGKGHTIEKSTPTSEKCNNHQPQLDPGGHSVIGLSSCLGAVWHGHNVLSTDNHVWGDLHTPAGPQIDRESPEDKIKVLFACFLASAALSSILVWKCKRKAVPQCFPDNLSMSCAVKPAVCYCL